MVQGGVEDEESSCVACPIQSPDPSVSRLPSNRHKQMCEKGPRDSPDMSSIPSLATSSPSKTCTTPLEQMAAPFSPPSSSRLWAAPAVLDVGRRRAWGRETDKKV